MTNIKINIVSDTICPWCYVGLRKLQAAQAQWLQRHPADTFTVRFKPFQLHPELPRGISRPKSTVYAEKFGGDRMAMIFGHLAKVGEPLGIRFKFGGNLGSTRDSHRLIRLGGKLGGEALERKTVEALFAAYFENEKDITDMEELRVIARAAGIPDAEFDKSMAGSDEGGAEVDKDVDAARYNGVSGVPDFTIQDRFNFSGAQDPAVFLEIFEKVKARDGAGAASVAQGNSC
jgi:predicted DsbA family dithiol-disulfide isomerase